VISDHLATISDPLDAIPEGQLTHVPAVRAIVATCSPTSSKKSNAMRFPFVTSPRKS